MRRQPFGSETWTRRAATQLGLESTIRLPAMLAEIDSRIAIPSPIPPLIPLGGGILGQTTPAHL